jgi:uncharacterized protein
MTRILATLATLLCLCTSLQAECVGQNMIAALSPEDRAALDAMTAKSPYPKGNFWRATRGDQVVNLIGTYHFDDPRHVATMAALTPLITDAKTVLVEAGPDEEKALQSHIAKDPSAMLIMSGPTLLEQLPPDDWKALSEAMTARQIPPFMVAKFKPWYITVMLSIPPCAMATAVKPNGLDARVIAAAVAAKVPVKALEPYDTIFGIFGALSNEDQLSMIKSTLAMEEFGADLSVTLADAYFSQDSRLIWEFTRMQALTLPGYTPEQVEAEFARMEEVLMAKRNRSWIPVIEAAAAQGHTFAAFGALHLSGQNGVLALLERAGFKLERLPF